MNQPDASFTANTEGFAWPALELCRDRVYGRQTVLRRVLTTHPTNPFGVRQPRPDENISMSMTDLDVHESELRLIPGLDVEVAETLRALKTAAMDDRPRLVDTTMLFAPRSGGVKRYLLSKKAWMLP